MRGGNGRFLADDLLVGVSSESSENQRAYRHGQTMAWRWTDKRRRTDWDDVVNGGPDRLSTGSEGTFGRYGGV
jgi:hypothetical protein